MQTNVEADLRIHHPDVQNNTRCPYSTFALMNMKHEAFLPECNLSQAMRFIKPESDRGDCSLHLNLIPLKRMY